MPSAGCLAPDSVRAMARRLALARRRSETPRPTPTGEVHASEGLLSAAGAGASAGASQEHAPLSARRVVGRRHKDLLVRDGVDAPGHVKGALGVAIQRG